MKYFLCAFALLAAGVFTAGGTTHTIMNSGFTFSPTTLTVGEGDTIVFSLASIHTAREVSQSTWNVNGTTPVGGGFDLPDGGGTVVITGVGVHYYVCVPHASIGMKGTITVNPVTDVRPVEDPLPARFLLEQNYPNPFNPSTTMKISVGRTAFTVVSVYAADGRRVKTLVSETLAPGSYTVTWDGTDERGTGVGSDVYFVRMVSGTENGGFRATRKLLLLR